MRNWVFFMSSRKRKYCHFQEILLLAPPKVVKMTTSGAASDENFAKMAFAFQCWKYELCNWCNTGLDALCTLSWIITELDCVLCEILSGIVSDELSPSYWKDYRNHKSLEYSVGSSRAPDKFYETFHQIYRQTYNIRRTLMCNIIVDNSDVVGASPVGAAPTTYLTPGFNRLGKDNCKTRWETFKFRNLVRLKLEILRYVTPSPFIPTTRHTTPFATSCRLT